MCKDKIVTICVMVMLVCCVALVFIIGYSQGFSRGADLALNALPHEQVVTELEGYSYPLADPMRCQHEWVKQNVGDISSPKEWYECRHCMSATQSPLIDEKPKSVFQKAYDKLNL